MTPLSILILGDSISTKPTGAKWVPYGTWLANDPDLPVTVINRAMGGHTTQSLLDQWSTAAHYMIARPIGERLRELAYSDYWL